MAHPPTVGQQRQARQESSLTIRGAPLQPAATPGPAASARRVRGSIQSIQRAGAILQLLSGPTRRIGVAQLATELKLPKGTVHGILQTLRTVGLVEQHHESGKYQLGAALLPMGWSYLNANELRTCALNWADALATHTGESVRVGTPHEKQVLIVHHVLRPDDNRQALDVGSLLPAHATALGKAILAHNQDLTSKLNNTDLARYTTATVANLDRLHRQLREVSKRGWASDIGELLTGVASIAAPIQDHRHITVGAITITGPIDRLCTQRSPRAELSAYLTEAARAISRELGASPS